MQLVRVRLLAGSAGWATLVGWTVRGITAAVIVLAHACAREEYPPTLDLHCLVGGGAAATGLVRHAARAHLSALRKGKVSREQSKLDTAARWSSYDAVSARTVVCKTSTRKQKVARFYSTG